MKCGVIAECHFERNRFRAMRLIPLRLDPTGLAGAGDLKTRGRPSIARGPAATAILDPLAERSRPFATQLDRANDRAIISAG